jgi:hypothetical protein
MTTAPMAAYAHDQIDRARTELNVVSKYDPHSRRPRLHPGNRICQVVASQNFVSEDPVAYCDTALITK